MKRRDFLKITGTSAAAFALFPEDWVCAATPTALAIREFLQSDNPKVLALAQRVFDKCVLERLRTPTEPFLHTWIQAGGDYYKGQWIWDTMFVVDLLAILPEQKKTIRDIFQNYWDFQDRIFWNFYQL